MNNDEGRLSIGPLEVSFRQTGQEWLAAASPEAVNAAALEFAEDLAASHSASVTGCSVAFSQTQADKVAWRAQAEAQRSGLSAPIIIEGTMTLIEGGSITFTSLHASSPSFLARMMLPAMAAKLSSYEGTCLDLSSYLPHAQAHSLRVVDGYLELTGRF